MYGIVHGGTDTELRSLSAAKLSALPFDGFALGGALGRDRAEMLAMLAVLMPHLRREAPKHLLGIGDLPSLRAGAALGLDTFDSAWPTKAGRHGDVFTRDGVLKLRSAALAAHHDVPIEQSCGCPVCTGHSRAYLHHLYRAREPVLERLASLHNLAWTLRAMAELRREILEDRV
jgi:queuine tRNA-ribosyltransferase